MFGYELDDDFAKVSCLFAIPFTYVCWSRCCRYGHGRLVIFSLRWQHWRPPQCRDSFTMERTAVTAVSAGIGANQ